MTTGGALPGPFFSALKLRSQTTTLQGSVFYRVHEDAVFALDVGGGVRFWNLDTKLEILPDSPTFVLTTANRRCGPTRSSAPASG